MRRGMIFAEILKAIPDLSPSKEGSEAYVLAREGLDGTVL